MAGMTGRGRVVRGGLVVVSIATAGLLVFEAYRLAFVGAVALITVCVFLLLDIRQRNQAIARVVRQTKTDLASVHAVLGELSSDVKRSRSEVADLIARSRGIESQVADGLGHARELRAAGRALEESLKSEFQHAEVRLLAEIKEVASALGSEQEAAATRHGTVTASLRRVLHEPVAQLQALDQLRARLGDAVDRLPLLGGWAIDPSTALLLSNEIAERQPARVVECGSGSSTVWIAEMLRQEGAGYLISIEHDAHYVEVVEGMLLDHGLSEWAEVRHAPLTRITDEGSDFTWYETAAVADIEDIQLILVDGPPATTGRKARYPAVPVLASQLVPGARIIVDDARRTDERQTIAQWQAEGLVEEHVTRAQSAVVLTRS